MADDEHGTHLSLPIAAEEMPPTDQEHPPGAVLSPNPRMVQLHSGEDNSPVPLGYQMDVCIFQTEGTKIRGMTGLFHGAPSVRLAATQLNICMKIRAETSAVPGSHGPLTPQASRLQGSAKHSAGAIRKTIISIQMCAGGL